MTALKPKRRWFQFSLRTLLLFMLVACTGLSWFAMKKKQGKRQWAAAAAIDRLGGTVAWNEMAKRPQQWLIDLLGVEFFYFPDTVNVRSLKGNDSGFGHLKDLPKLEQLIVDDPHVTDASLYDLKGLRRLRVLCLGAPQVTDAGLEHLKGLSQLRYLGLERTNVTDEGVKKLQDALPNCNIER